ncbi:MAG: ATP-binding cassette domain-containing protein, partial [Spirochaetaceae bacterium]|nr:ATP-binding cassette domain-containing protein [Spirochaetaceae bacterium]
MPSTSPIIRASQVSREFVLGQERVQAVRKVDMELSPGRLALIRGKSGSGKTTLLNILGGLDRPTTGVVFYHERDLHIFSEREMTRWRRTSAAFVFQAFALIPGLTAAENVDVPLRIAGISPRDAGKRALQYL